MEEGGIGGLYKESVEGSRAKHLDKDNPKVKPIMGQLISALSTHSQEVSTQGRYLEEGGIGGLYKESVEGSLAKHLDKDNPKVKPIMGQLISALSTHSQEVSTQGGVIGRRWDGGVYIRSLWRVP